jgi:ferritin-like metal-binding protein YciE
MSTVIDVYTTGLKNAHAMEHQALAIMRPQVSRIEHYPDVADRLSLHISETEEQIGRLEELLSLCDAEQSSLKDTALSIGGTMAAIGHSVAPDEIVKNSFANFAFEHYEIAAYLSLLALAEDAGFEEARTLLDRSLEEEIAMAEWIEGQIQPLTLRFASLKASGSDAKI